MNKNERDSIRKYNSIANRYDLSKEGRFTLRYRHKILDICDIKDGYRVLDVGCGNGSLIDAMTKKANIDAYGLDISPKMIEESNTRYDNIDFRVSSTENLPFSEDFFDIVIICCVLHHLYNPDAFFTQAYRVLKPDGVLIVGEPWNPFPIKQLLDYVVSPLLRAGDNKTFTRKRLHKLFVENGFEISKDSYEREYMQVIKGRKIILDR